MDSTSQPQLFSSKVPASVAFAVAVLLFFMPFIDIKCNNMSLQTVSGVQLATGFKMKNNSSNNSLLNDFKTDEVDKTITKTTTKTDKNDPNLFAMVALGLGLLGFGLSFTNIKAGIGGAIVTAIASVGCMIGLFLDIKGKVKADYAGTSRESGVGKFGRKLTESMGISVDFTPWFYVSVIAFLAAAFLAYKRMSSMNR